MNKQYILYIIMAILVCYIYYRIYHDDNRSEKFVFNNFSLINRVIFIDKIDKNKLTLEIGALHSPIINPRIYKNVYIIDVFDTDTLRKNYKDDTSLDINDIVDVDYVWSGQKYNELITDKKFDQVISSHNIEHQPDLINYLNNISSILKPGGLVYLFIPDKRYSFDKFRSESDIIDILSANIRKDIKPQISTILDSRIKNTHNDVANHWNNDHGINKIDDIQHLITVYTELNKIYNNNKYEYIDTHVWKLTPQSFVKNINLLYSMKILDLNLKFCSETEQNSLEFYAILQKTEDIT
jgi:SAM-dependent methyltransferase